MIGACAIAIALGASNGSAADPDRTWPAGTQVLSFENLDGIILLSAMLHGTEGRDSAGFLVLDTGAGYLALDHSVAHDLGLTDSLGDPTSLEFTERALPRLVLGAQQIDQVSPVLMVDVGIVKRVTDRSVLGLLGQRVLTGRAVFIDYRRKEAALIPAMGGGAARAWARRQRSADSEEGSPSPENLEASRAVFGDLLPVRAVPVPFRLAGDGKMLVRARASDPWAPKYGAWLTLIVDTGASKCVLFEDALVERNLHYHAWTALGGLSAPTLLGSSAARITRIPSLEVAASPNLVVRDIDAALMRSELSGVLERAVKEPVHGLLGYSFLRRFRVAVDYPNRIMWLDPLPGGWNDRPYEYSHVGIQLERSGSDLRVMAVADRSPAAVAGIAVGDRLISVDGQPVSGFDLITVARRLEGPPGTRVQLTVRRGSLERSYRLARRRLL